MAKHPVPTVVPSIAQRRAKRLRAEIALLLDSDSDIVEWNSRICPDCHHDVLAEADCPAMPAPHLPPLYYALAPEDRSGDRALGLGETPEAALADLLWALQADRLLVDLHTCA